MEELTDAKIDEVLQTIIQYASDQKQGDDEAEEGAGLSAVRHRQCIRPPSSVEPRNEQATYRSSPSDAAPASNR